jgi:hypothetical protein
MSLKQQGATRQKPDWKRNVLTEEKLDNVGARLEISSRSLKLQA